MTSRVRLLYPLLFAALPILSLAAMPDVGLTEAEARDIAAFLAVNAKMSQAKYGS